MSHQKLTLVTTLAIALGTAVLAAHAQDKMYFTGNGNGPDKIRRANLDGRKKEDLVVGLGAPGGIALDTAGGKMYWTNSGKVQRADLDGSSVETIVAGLGFPKGITVDPGGGKVYWTDSGTHKIQRANLDGSNVEDLVTSGLNAPVAITLDLGAGKMYWTDINTDKIQRANLDGSNVEDLLVADGGDIALDTGAGKMYWISGHNIQRADLDGSNVEVIVTGLRWGKGIALDLGAGKMYWADCLANKIQRANLDGSNIENLINHGLDTKMKIARDLGPGGCNGDERIKKAKCKTRKGKVKKYLVKVKNTTAGVEYTAALDTGQTERNTAGKSVTFKFKGGNAPPCGPNGVTVCGKHRDGDCDC